MTDKQSMPASGEAHVWYGDPDVLVNSELAEAYGELLSDEERVQAKRFQFETDRRQYVFAHALLRVVISRYIQCTPTEIGFRRNYYGKPALAYPEGSKLEFNISHTPGLAICAVGNGCSVGVDVERMRRNVDELGLARRYFSQSEYAQLKYAPAACREQLFFRLWTLKEAYIKARGIGLSIPLADFSFEFPANESPTISFARTIDDLPSMWHFSSVALTERHHAAVALHLSQGPCQGCHWRKLIPLCGLTEVPSRVAS